MTDFFLPPDRLLALWLDRLGALIESPPAEPTSVSDSLLQFIVFFFPPDRPVALGLNAGILVLVLASLAELSRAWEHVRVNEKDLRRAENSSLEDETAGKALEHLRTKLTSGSEVERRLVQLAESNDAGEPIDQDILAAISAENFRDAVPLARLAVSVLVLLGLAGTLVGLSMAVTHLSELLGGSMGAQQMANAILGTLGDMKVAFSTTLAGVLGAVVVSSGLATLRHRQSAALRRLEILTATGWIPVYQTTDDSRLKDVVEELQGIRETFAQDAGNLVDEVAELRDATLKILGERGEDSPSLAQYVESVRQTTEKLQAGVEDVSDKMLPEIRETLKEAIRKEQAAVAETLQQHTAAVQPMLEKQGAAAQALHEAVAGELERLVELQALLERLSKSFEAARGTWEKADESIERMGRETAQAVRDGLGDALEGVARLTEQQARSHERMSSVLADFQGTQAEAMQLLAEQSRRSLNQTQEMVQQIRETVRESLERVADSLAKSQQGAGERVATGMTSLARELRELARPAGRDEPDRVSRPERPHEKGGAGVDVRPTETRIQDGVQRSVEELRRDLKGLT